MITIKVELESDKQYTVELYPSRKTVLAKYQGKYINQHLFVDEKGTTLALPENLLAERDGIITMVDMPFASIGIISQRKILEAGGLEVYMQKYFGEQK